MCNIFRKKYAKSYRGIHVRAFIFSANKIVMLNIFHFFAFFCPLKKILDIDIPIVNYAIKRYIMGIPGVALNKADILGSIRKNNGIIADAAAYLGCNRQAIYNWMDNDPEVKAAVNEARAEADRDRQDQNQVLKAKAYKSASKLLDKSDCTMTIFTMKSLCGFEEKASTAPLKIEVINYSDRKDTPDPA